jgi:hypothetical protein
VLNSSEAAVAGYKRRTWDTTDHQTQHLANATQLQLRLSVTGDLADVLTHLILLTQLEVQMVFARIRFRSLPKIFLVGITENICRFSETLVQIEGRVRRWQVPGASGELFRR